MKKQQKIPLLGAHMSISGGLENALYAGSSIDCTAIQLFTHSNRQWHIKALTTGEITRFDEARKKTGINAIVVHASYLINLASPDTATREKSINALIQEVTRCEQLGIPYVVVHPGARLSSPIDEAIARLAQSVDAILEAVPGKSMLLLENMAGQGSVVCSSFEELAAARKAAHHKKRVGFCFDTCHAFAAGYAMETAPDYHALWEQFDATIGIEHLKAMHLNDSLKDKGSRVDRHAHIGQGKIGLEFFKLLMNDSRFVDIPKILETPKDESLKEDVMNLATLTGLIK